MIFEYKDIEELSLTDKLKIFGWVSDLLAQVNPGATIETHKDKIKMIKDQQSF